MVYHKVLLSLMLGPREFDGTTVESTSPVRLVLTRQRGRHDSAIDDRWGPEAGACPGPGVPGAGGGAAHGRDALRRCAVPARRAGVAGAGGGGHAAAGQGRSGAPVRGGGARRAGDPHGGRGGEGRGPGRSRAAGLSRDEPALRAARSAREGRGARQGGARAPGCPGAGRDGLQIGSESMAKRWIFTGLTVAMALGLIGLLAYTSESVHRVAEPARSITEVPRPRITPAAASPPILALPSIGARTKRKSDRRRTIWLRNCTWVVCPIPRPVRPFESTSPSAGPWSRRP